MLELNTEYKIRGKCATQNYTNLHFNENLMRTARNKGREMVVVGGTWQVTKLKILYNAAHLQLTKEILLRNYLFAVVVYSQNLGWFLYQILANFRLRFDSVLSSFMVAG